MAKCDKSDEPHKAETKCFMELLRDYFRSYCEKSTIHCVRYLYDPQLHNLERLIWCLLLSVSIALSWFFYLMLSERFVSQKLQTVVQDPQYPVYMVDFPAVGICTDNRINWSLLEAAKTEFLPANASLELVEYFISLVARLETLRFGSYLVGLSELEDDNLEAVDFINVTALASFLTLSCQDIMVPNSCLWRSSSFDCCEYFVMEKTEFGFCLVFNSELSPRSKEIKQREGSKFYPRHNAKAGQSTGLNFDLLINESFKRPNSLATDKVYIMVKKPDQMSNVVYSMTQNTETYVTVRPDLTWTDESTRSIPPGRRNCLFIDEQLELDPKDSAKRFGKPFQLTNCLNRCHESYLIELCNCSLPIFFLHNKIVKECTPTSLRCIARHNDIFSYDKRREEDALFSATKPGMTCSCLVNCYLLDYYTSTTTLPLSVKRIPKDPQLKLFKVDVHYQVETTPLYRTSLEFTTIDLIANLGGIFGLCLGASMVSGFELIYYLTIGFGMHLYDNSYFGVLRQKVKMNWHTFKRYLQNEVSHLADHQVHPTQAKEEAKGKIRHPLQHERNAW
ncbi:pickpocket protein 19 [Drosophila subobscura]|uniref:pickpocket protein 19 n=1 Tax=Drosophila subobscura TaxID=7241 RepID=UPI00155B1FF6|nr:pickpocket protein 19 [Drosophila subobscura]XP_034661365.1 pickpocket protein 19 [Drosophila subobscura]